MNRSQQLQITAALAAIRALRDELLTIHQTADAKTAKKLNPCIGYTFKIQEGIAGLEFGEAAHD